MRPNLDKRNGNHALCKNLKLDYFLKRKKWNTNRWKRNKIKMLTCPDLILDERSGNHFLKVLKIKLLYRSMN